jgi:hypothetical protein
MPQTNQNSFFPGSCILKDKLEQDIASGLFKDASQQSQYDGIDQQWKLPQN